MTEYQGRRVDGEGTGCMTLHSASRIRRLVPALLMVFLLCACRSGATTPRPTPTPRLRLPEDGYAWWILLRADAFPDNWHPEGVSFDPSVDLAKCMPAETAFRTGAANSDRFASPNGGEHVTEFVSVFDNAEHALTYLGALPSKWRCEAEVFNAGKAITDAYSYAVATAQPLESGSPNPDYLAYRWDVLIRSNTGPLAYIHDTENWLAEADGRVVIELRHSSGVGPPNIAATVAYLQKALAKVGLQPPTPAAKP
ncbi:MAG TPA: hypothetical protein VEZ14_06900 [Dehalococcoidia bacterium]|nr:hypothetical protein [Dehalococcoidia bacterium]